MSKSIEVPELDHDRMMETKYNHKVSPNGRLERRIVANFVAHMVARDWIPCEVYDREERTPVTDAKSAMELIFNLDEAFLYFKNTVTGRKHYVFLVLGNGCHIISDYSYSVTDNHANPFDKSVDSFEPEDFA